MSLRKIGRYYWLDLRIRGIRIRRSLKTSNKEIALIRYPLKKAELLHEFGEKKARLADFIDKYIEWAWSTKPASAQREEQRLRIIQEILSKDKILFLDEINSYIVEGIKINLRKRGRAKSTVNQYIGLIRRLYNRAADWEIYEGKNPARKVRLYTQNSHREALSAKNVDAIVSKAKEISLHPRSRLQKLFPDLILLALNTGMRRSEILYLRWQDIKEDEILIRGKGGKRRAIPLNQVAKDVILSQPRRSEFVFHLPNRDKPTLFKRTIERVRRETRIEWSFHTLRHTFATMLLERGVDIITIGSILGHSKVYTSLIYSHTSREKMKKAVDILGSDKGMV